MYSFTPPLPPHKRPASDPRQNRDRRNNFPSSTQSFSSSEHNQMPSTPRSSSSAHNRMSSTPISSGYFNMPSTPMSPYGCVPSTPRSPFDHSGMQNSYDPLNGRINNDQILDPDTFEIRNYKHPDFIANFYQAFKTYPPELITHQVHQNCVTVLKHVIHQLTEQREIFRKDSQKVRLASCQKDQKIHELLMSEPVRDEETINKLMKEIDQLKNENQALRQQKATDKNTIDQSKREVGRLSYANEGFIQEINDYKKRIKDLENSVGQLKAKNQKLFDKSSNDKEIIIRLKKDIQLLNDKLHQSEYDSNLLKEDLAELTDANKKLQDDAEKKAKGGEQRRLEAVVALAKSCEDTVAKFKQKKSRQLASKQQSPNETLGYKRTAQQPPDEEEDSKPKKSKLTPSPDCLSPSSTTSEASNSVAARVTPNFSKITNEIFTSQGPIIRKLLKQVSNPDAAIPQEDDNDQNDSRMDLIIKQLRDFSEDEKMKFKVFIENFFSQQFDNIAECGMKGYSAEQKQNFKEMITSHFDKLIQSIF